METAAPKKVKHLLIEEYNGNRNDSTPKLFVLPVLRQTPNYYFTSPSVAFGIVGYTPIMRRSGQVAWSKKSKHRRGDLMDQYELTYRVKKVLYDLEDLPEGAIEL